MCARPRESSACPALSTSQTIACPESPAAAVVNPTFYICHEASTKAKLNLIGISRNFIATYTGTGLDWMIFRQEGLWNDNVILKIGCGSSHWNIQKLSWWTLKNEAFNPWVTRFGTAIVSMLDAASIAWWMLAGTACNRAEFKGFAEEVRREQSF
jgi:hypothetical protein